MEFTRPFLRPRPALTKSPRRRGISLVEALVSITITTLAGAAVLTSLGAAVRSSSDAIRTTVAQGLAEQLMDEIAAVRFPDGDSSLSTGSLRSEFEDIDEYNGWSSRPPVDRKGRTLGTEGSVAGLDAPRPEALRPDPDFLNRFTREVEVQRVRPDGNNGWLVVTQHTDFRRVLVRVRYTDAQSNTVLLAELSRIFSYVPIAP